MSTTASLGQWRWDLLGAVKTTLGVVLAASAVLGCFNLFASLAPEEPVRWAVVSAFERGDLTESDRGGLDVSGS